MAGVGVCAGKSKRCFMDWISIFSKESRSPLLRFHDSALLRSMGIDIFSWSSSKTVVSILRNTSVSAMAFIVVVAAVSLFFHISRFFAFFPSCVMRSPRYLYDSVSSMYNSPSFHCFLSSLCFPILITLHLLAPHFSLCFTAKLAIV